MLFNFGSITLGLQFKVSCVAELDVEVLVSSILFLLFRGLFNDDVSI